MMDTKQIFGSSYHPNTQGLVERFNGTLATMLAKVTSKQQDNWDKMLPYVVFAYNTAQHENLETSPFTMIYGREGTLPLDVSVIPTPLPEWEHKDYLENFQKRIQILHQKGLYNLQQSQQKVESSRPPLTTLPDYPIGNKVWIFDPVVPLRMS